MPMAWPVTPRAASEARKGTRAAQSSGVPKPSPLRRKSGSGSPFFIASMYGAKAGIVSVIAVAATGTIALTVMFARLSSMDQVRAMAAMPALAAA